MQTDWSFTSKCPVNEEQMMEHSAAATAADGDYYVFCYRKLKQLSSPKEKRKDNVMSLTI